MTPHVNHKIALATAVAVGGALVVLGSTYYVVSRRRAKALDTILEKELVRELQKSVRRMQSGRQFLTRDEEALFALIAAVSDPANLSITCLILLCNFYLLIYSARLSDRETHGMPSVDYKQRERMYKSRTLIPSWKVGPLQIHAEKTTTMDTASKSRSKLCTECRYSQTFSSGSN
mmetsp:Transcript_39951/g.159007  ORF Transcript_39951/g.159007 Transcript_39951/m.159007 type:complete len:175 (+) Transcript_39951:180-704(+)